ncbi:MAG: hypothetical protein ACR2P3_05210 [Geminicoccaceae bacterium]
MAMAINNSQKKSVVMTKLKLKTLAIFLPVIFMAACNSDRQQIAENVTDAAYETKRQHDCDRFQQAKDSARAQLESLTIGEVKRLKEINRIGVFMCVEDIKALTDEVIRMVGEPT